MSISKVVSVSALFLGALAADYVRTKLVGSYDFPEDNDNKETVTDNKEQDSTDDN